MLRFDPFDKIHPEDHQLSTPDEEKSMTSKYENYQLHQTFTVEENILDGSVREKIRVRRIENGYLYFRDLYIYSGIDQMNVVTTSTFVPNGS